MGRALRRRYWGCDQHLLQSSRAQLAATSAAAHLRDAEVVACWHRTSQWLLAPERSMLDSASWLLSLELAAPLLLDGVTIYPLLGDAFVHRAMDAHSIADPVELAMLDLKSDRSRPVSRHDRQSWKLAVAAPAGRGAAPRDRRVRGGDAATGAARCCADGRAQARCRWQRRSSGRRDVAASADELRSPARYGRLSRDDRQ